MLCRLWFFRQCVILTPIWSTFREFNVLSFEDSKNWVFLKSNNGLLFKRRAFERFISLVPSLMLFVGFSRFQDIVSSIVNELKEIYRRLGSAYTAIVMSVECLKL